MSVRTAAILAAGRGTRMGPLGEVYPKAILPIGNEALIHRQLRLLSGRGIEDVIIVVGHHEELVRRAVACAPRSTMAIRFLRQREMNGAAQAVSELQRHVKPPFLLLLGDIFFVPSDLNRLFTQLAPEDTACVLAARRETDVAAIRGNFLVNAAEDGRILRVVEKPAVTAPALKGVGIYAFKEAIFDAIARTPPAALRQERELTDAIQTLIDSGWTVKAADAVTYDVNLNSAQELLRANLAWLSHVGLDNLMDPDTRLHPDVRLHQCVVGKGVTIDPPADLEKCLIFEGVHLKGPGILTERVIASTPAEVF